MELDQSGRNNVVGDWPVAMDLDAALLRTEPLMQSRIAALASNPPQPWHLVALLIRNAALKSGVIPELPIDIALLPYDDRVLALIKKSRDAGCKVYFSSALT
jgi:hypothetical protein